MHRTRAEDAPTAAHTSSPKAAPADAYGGLSVAVGSRSLIGSVVMGREAGEAGAGAAGGKLVKFSLTPGVPSPLLSWTGEQGDKLELFGTTFEFSKQMDSLEDAQWFSRLSLAVNGVTLLNVSRGEAGFGQMEVDVRGVRIPGAEGELAAEVSGEGLVQAALSLRRRRLRDT